jgi:hypothetical protein
MARARLTPGISPRGAQRMRTPCSRHQRSQLTSVGSGAKKLVISPTIGCWQKGRAATSDWRYRHALPVLALIESFQRPCVSDRMKITHMNRTLATSYSVNLSTARTIDPRQNASQGPHRYFLTLETNTLLAPGPRTWTIASAVAVIAHRQRPPIATSPQVARSESRSPTSLHLRRQ